MESKKYIKMRCVKAKIYERKSITALCAFPMRRRKYRITFLYAVTIFQAYA